MESELVSVVLCTYNGLQFIAPQLRSIQEQSYRPIEIIIVDDSSTDGTYEWLMSEALKDQRIRLFQNFENVGFNLNFNKACGFVKGTYVAIADQDDVWETNKLSVLVAALKERKNTVLVHCISARFENEGKPNKKSCKLIHHFCGSDARQFFLANIISGHNMVLKRELLDASMPFPREGYYDWWLVINACCIGRIVAVEKILVWHRIHNNNATGRAKRQVLFYKQVQAFLPHVLAIKNLPQNSKDFGEKLLYGYNKLEDRKFSISLFLFLLKNAPVLFAYKKRKFPWLSYTKNAIRFSSASA